MKRLIKRVLGWIDSLLFPEDVLCLACERALDEGGQDGLCSACQKALEQLALAQETIEREQRELPAGIAYVHAAYLYDAQARRLIHRLKYERVRAAAAPLARRMALLPSGEEEVIVPVPTDRMRARRRGFNQATLLSEHMGRALGMEVACALERTHRRRPQTGLGAAQRKENMHGCMRVRPGMEGGVKGKRVLLADDVYTTGATAAEGARALLAAGARSVGVFAGARAAGLPNERDDPFAAVRRARIASKTLIVLDKIYGKQGKTL